MKAIYSEELPGGDFAEVGMTHRTVLEGKTVVYLHKKARDLAKDKAYRLEIFRDANIYGSPFRIDYRG